MGRGASKERKRIGIHRMRRGQGVGTAYIDARYKPKTLSGKILRYTAQIRQVSLIAGELNSTRGPHATCVPAASLWPYMQRRGEIGTGLIACAS